MVVVRQILQRSFDEPNFMAKSASNLTFAWRSRLSRDCPEQSPATRESIIRWLIGSKLERFERLNPNQLEITQQAMEYRYRILRQRYLGREPEQTYRNLMQRLGSSVLLRNEIRTWIALSRDRSLAAINLLQEVIQELLQSDRYMQQQMKWIARCTGDPRLRNALLFASAEEYCLRPIRNQPLLIYQFVNYLRRTSQRGLKQTHISELSRVISEEIRTKDSDNPISLAADQDTQAMEEQQVLRSAVKQEFESYLASQLEPVAVQWFRLYLQGWSQQVIACCLNLQVKEVYELKEKIRLCCKNFLRQ